MNPGTPKTVFVFPNGMAVVCDEKGKQIPELQGKFEDVKEKILKAADGNTEFNGWPNVTCVTRFRKDDH